MPLKSWLPASIQFIVPLAILLLLLSACAPGSGVFSGGSWQSSGLADYHIHALVVDPNNVNAIYAGDTQGAVFASTDAGTHWSKRGALSPEAAINDMAFNPPGKKLYAATSQGLFVSNDAGQRWSAITTSALPTDSYTTLAFNLNAPKVVYAGSARRGVFMSTDDGATWTPIDTNLPQGISINGLAYDTNQQQLWAATSLGIYRSDNKGTTWQALNTGLPVGVRVNVVQLAASAGGAQGLVYAGTTQGFFRSRDAGQHWLRGNDTLENTSIYSLLVDFRNSNTTTLYAGTSVGTLLSQDSGQTWGSVAAGLPKGTAVYALALGSDSYAQLYSAANDVYLYPGNSGGLSPARLVPLLLLLGFFYGLFSITARSRRNRQLRNRKPATSTKTPSPTTEG